MYTLLVPLEVVSCAKAFDLGTVRLFAAIRPGVLVTMLPSRAVSNAYWPDDLAQLTWRQSYS